MTLIHLNFIHHYHLPQLVVRPIKGPFVASNRDAFKVSREHYDTVIVTSNFGFSTGLKDYDLIDCVDLTESLSTKILDLCGESTLTVGGTKGYVRGKAYSP